MGEVKELPAGLGLLEWAQQVGISRPTYYTIAREHQPRNVKVGRRLIIIERPGDWLERMRQAGGAKIVPYRERRKASLLPKAA